MDVLALEESPLELPLTLASHAAKEGRISTAHLLKGLTWHGAGEPLAAVEMTTLVIEALFRAHELAGPGPDDSPAIPEHTYRLADKTVPLTPAAQAALDRTVAAAGPRATPVELLTHLLEDETSQAVEVLRLGRVDVAALRAALAEGRTPDFTDRVEVSLRPTRDVLIGRTQYGGSGLFGRLKSALNKVVKMNVARVPVYWARYEANAQAQRRGTKRARTDDVILGILATHEVAQLYPFLVQDAADKYGGGAALAEAGVTYASALAAAESADLGTDAHRIDDLAPKGPDFPRDTADLLARLIRTPDTRAARLIDVLGVRDTVST
ncbi:hypothetical protein [Cryptosporangium arvum]|uniref:hypothetical protein n=1 Tax=Cryptosporangium arvum TaxID=80871 RepID=UPI0004B3DBB3|nr:hypothetical protein [Cryptosporangium arvum]